MAGLEIGIGATTIAPRDSFFSIGCCPVTSQGRFAAQLGQRQIRNSPNWCQVAAPRVLDWSADPARGGAECKGQMSHTAGLKKK
jgi:hypothetical protein